MKSLIPLSIRTIGRQFLNRHWFSRRYDSPLFGFLWSLVNKDYKTESLRFKLPHEMMPMGFRSRFYFDAYEDGERILCKKYITQDDSIVELGACIGVVSCVCNRILNSSKKHVVVEANPTLIPWLEKNRSENGSEFEIEHGMLSKSSDGTFRIEKFIVSGSANTTTGEIVNVPVFGMENVCEKHGFVPSVIVMDIEGGEIDFLEENRDWLATNSQTKTMVIEMHPFIVGEDAIENCKSTLNQLGFSMIENIGLVETWKRS
jgi:FkbM family methyltransferase